MLWSWKAKRKIREYLKFLNVGSRRGRQKITSYLSRFLRKYSKVIWTFWHSPNQSKIIQWRKQRSVLWIEWGTLGLQKDETWFDRITSARSTSPRHFENLIRLVEIQRSYSSRASLLYPFDSHSLAQTRPERNYRPQLIHSSPRQRFASIWDLKKT